MMGRLDCPSWCPDHIYWPSDTEPKSAIYTSTNQVVLTQYLLRASYAYSRVVCVRKTFLKI